MLTDLIDLYVSNQIVHRFPCDIIDKIFFESNWLLSYASYGVFCTERPKTLTFIKDIILIQLVTFVCIFISYLFTKTISGKWIEVYKRTCVVCYHETIIDKAEAYYASALSMIVS